MIATSFYITKFKQKTPARSEEGFPLSAQHVEITESAIKICILTLWIEAVTWNDPVSQLCQSFCLRTSLWSVMWNGWFAVGSSLSWELFRCKPDLGLNSNFEGPCSTKQKCVCVCVCVCGGYWVAHKIHEFGKLRTISEKLQDICKIQSFNM